MPALVGESERTAQLRLQQDGLELAAASEIRSADYPAGRRGRADAAAEDAARARVALLVNRGERGATYVMPDLIGVNGDRAADVLRVARLPRGGRRRPSLSGRAGRASCCGRTRRPASRSPPASRSRSRSADDAPML